MLNSMCLNHFSSFMRVACTLFPARKSFSIQRIKHIWFCQNPSSIVAFLLSSSFALMHSMRLSAIFIYPMNLITYENTFAEHFSYAFLSNIKNVKITLAGNSRSNQSEWKICDLFNARSKRIVLWIMVCAECCSTVFHSTLTIHSVTMLRLTSRSHSFSCNSLLELRHKFRMRECEFGTENMLDWIQEKRATKMNISYVIIFFSSPFGRAYITILFSSNVHLESRGNVNRLQ